MKWRGEEWEETEVFSKYLIKKANPATSTPRCYGWPAGRHGDMLKGIGIGIGIGNESDREKQKYKLREKKGKWTRKGKAQEK